MADVGFLRIADRGECPEAAGRRAHDPPTGGEAARLLGYRGHRAFCGRITRQSLRPLSHTQHPKKPGDLTTGQRPAGSTGCVISSVPVGPDRPPAHLPVGQVPTPLS